MENERGAYSDVVPAVMAASGGGDGGTSKNFTRRSGMETLPQIVPLFSYTRHTNI